MQSYLDQHNSGRQKRDFRLKLYLGLLILLLIFALIFYILAYSPVFQIREFEIAGAKRLSDQSVLNIVRPIVIRGKMGAFLGIKNLLIWQEKDLDVSKTALLEAQVSRDWIRQTVSIQIKERERLAIWCDQYNNCYWIDENGIMFEEAPETEGSLILTVFSNSKKTSIKGLGISEQRFIENIIKALKGISAMRLPVKKILFDERLQELRVETYSGPDLLLSIRFDPTSNLNSLKSLEEKTSFSKIDYVDLRVENRLYYKNF